MVHLNWAAKHLQHILHIRQVIVFLKVPKEAAVNAIGAVPGGRVFKGMKALGAGKRLSRLGSATQSLARYDELPGVSTSNPFSRGVNKVIEKGSEYVGKAYKKLRKK